MEVSSDQFIALRDLDSDVVALFYSDKLRKFLIMKEALERAGRITTYDKISFVSVNVDGFIDSRLNVVRIPQMQFVKSGKLIYRKQGFLRYDEIIDRIHLIWG